MIEVSKLRKRYKKSTTDAVKGISFNVKEGEFFAFLGPNGAGKTTTISILTTTLTKTAGSIKVAGFDLDQSQDDVRRNIGIIFQSPSLDLNLSGEENIRFHTSLYGVYGFRPSFRLMPKAYKARIKELAAILDMQDEINKPVKTYSGGMKRKLEIVRSLTHQPKILFLDEPTTGLDPISRKNLWDYIDSVRRDFGTTVFLTTHYLDEAENADTVSIINHGKIVAQGSPDKIKEELVTEYLIVDSSDRDGLMAELKAKRLKFESRDEIWVQTNGKNLQQLISDIKTPLSSLRTSSPTLEQAYVDIIGGQE